MPITLKSVHNFKEIKVGGLLTIDGNMISSTGHHMYDKGDKVEVAQIIIQEGYWSNFFNVFYEDKLHVIVIKGQSCHWLPNAFVETKSTK